MIRSSATAKRPAQRKLEVNEERRTRKAEQSEATRSDLMAVARELFAERGYSGVGTEEIVRRARVTRGARYYHFRDKKDLFRAVHEQVEAELAEQLGRHLAEGPTHDPIELLRRGAHVSGPLCGPRAGPYRAGRRSICAGLGGVAAGG